MSGIDHEVLDEFLLEAGELLGNAEEDILEIEQTTDKEVVNRIFRAFHTVKGNASMIGLEDPAVLAHHAEDTLVRVRNGTLKPTKPLIDILLKVKDALLHLLEDSLNDVTSAVDIPGLTAELDRIGGATEPGKAPGPAVSGAPKPAAVPPVPPALRILVAEDDFTSRKLIQLILRQFGEVDAAVNGMEAVDAFKASLAEGAAGPYHLVCMDIMMPELDGMDAAKKIRALEMEKGVAPGEETVIIMTTALGDPKTVIKSLYQCGATGFLVKPIDKELLEKEMKKHGLV